MTKIQQLIESSLAGTRRAKCLRRTGAILAGGAAFCGGIYSLLAEAVSQHLLPGFNKHVALTTILITASVGVLAYLIALIWLFGVKGKLFREIRAGKDFSRIQEPPARLIERLRRLGAQGLTVETFIRRETLAFLLERNGNYVQAWGKRVEGNTGQTEYADICFFVVAPLNEAGLKDMLPNAAGDRKIRNNKGLEQKHVVKDPTRCVALYVIELFGQGRRSRAAASSRLFEYLDQTLGAKLAGPHFCIFARPATDDGLRVTGHYSFKNLGEGEKEMHAWQAPDEGQDLCNVILSVFHAQAR